jgi:hypothetical protein
MDHSRLRATTLHSIFGRAWRTAPGPTWSSLEETENDEGREKGETREGMFARRTVG